MKKDPRMLRLIIANTLKKSWTVTMFIFFNIFIWKELQDFQLMIGFNFAYAFIHTIFFLIMSRVLKNGYRWIGLVISMVFSAAIFGLIAFQKEFILDNVLLIWGLLWVVNAIYRVIFNNNNFELTTYYNRWYYAGVRWSINTMGSLITPMLIWAIISLNIWGYWYEAAFLIGALMFLVAGFIWNIPLEYKYHRPYRFFHSVKKIIAHKDILIVNIFYMIWAFAFSNILLETLLPFLMYIQVEEEYKLWFLVSLFSGLNIIVSFLIWKYMQYTSYRQLLLWVWILYSIMMILIILLPQYIVLFTAVLGFLFIVYSTPVRVIMSNMFHKVKWYKKIVSEQMAFQEIFVMSGRMWALSALYFIWDFSQSSFTILFVFMIFCILATTYYFSTIDISHKPHHKKNEKKSQNTICTKKEATA